MASSLPLVTRMPLDECTRLIDAKKLNTNNYPTDFYGREISRDDYFAQMNETTYAAFLPFLDQNAREETFVRALSKSETASLLELSTIGVFRDITAKDVRSHDLSDLMAELDRGIASHHAGASETGSGANGWFFRLSECSPKDSPRGCRVTCAMDVFLALATSKRCLKSLSRPPEHIVLKPWRQDLDRKHADSAFGQYEFRTFVCDGKLTAVSQYHCNSAYDWSAYSDADFGVVVEKVGVAARALADRGLAVKRYVLDVLCAPSSEGADIIELNPFGMEQASGSALFEWVADAGQLYGMKDRVEVRLVVP